MDGILKQEERAVFALRSLYRRYGYRPYKMSRFEEYDLYVRNKDFLVSDQIITFSDRSGRLLALKPDVTLSIVKNAPEEPGVVQKVYYNENVYRDYREIMQAGLECVGDLSDYEIAEVVLLAAKSLELLRQEYVLNLSHMGLIGAVLRDCGLDIAQQKQAMDCLRRKNAHELETLCAGNATALETLRALCLCRGRADEVFDQLRDLVSSAAAQQALEEMESIRKMLSGAGYGAQVRLDFSVGSDMRYYSGVVFKGYLQGVPSSVLSGGQYDRLPQRMGKNVRAIGFALYLDLLEKLEAARPDDDVDTLILHDGSTDAQTLLQCVAESEQQGSVLVCKQAPTDRSWRRMIEFRNGKAVRQ